MPHISSIDWKLYRHIGLDLDETLASTVSGMLSHAQSYGDLLHISSIEDIRKHDASGLGSHLTAEEIMKIWERYGLATQDPEDIEPVEYSIAGVRRLYELGKDLSIVTARSNHESWKVERTTRWVRSHFAFLEKTDIYFVNHFTTDAMPKSHICMELGVSLMIDDAMENAHELCTNGVGCILLEKPWNRDVDFEHPFLYRAKDWREIITSLEK